jgi:hypothetical protein
MQNRLSVGSAADPVLQRNELCEPKIPSNPIPLWTRPCTPDGLKGGETRGLPVDQSSPCTRSGLRVDPGIEGRRRERG